MPAPEQPRPGTVVLLNGAPRSGTSTLARAMQERSAAATLADTVLEHVTTAALRALPQIAAC